MRFKKYEDYYYDNEDRYYEEKEEAFKEHILDQLNSYIESTDSIDLSIDNFCEEVEYFEFDDIDTWMSKEYEGMIGDYEDQKYEEWKDRQMGL